MEPTGQPVEVELRARLPKVEPGNKLAKADMEKPENPRLIGAAERSQQRKSRGTEWSKQRRG